MRKIHITFINIQMKHTITTLKVYDELKVEYICTIIYPALWTSLLFSMTGIFKVYVMSYSN